MMDVEAGASKPEEGRGRAHELDKEVLPWWKQITIRAALASILLSIAFNFMVCKLNLSTGIIPSFNVAAGLLGFALLKSYESVLKKVGWLRQPFTRQENTVIQTCVVASSGIAFSSGTASYILGMTSRIAAQADEGNSPINIKNFSPWWLMGFLFAVSFVGLFSILTLRKKMIVDFKLTYPSGTATAHLINSFHTPAGAKLAKKQVTALFKGFSFSFVFACIQWLVAAADGCGFGSMPTFGKKAFKQMFYFDFSSTYVGVGMITPYIVNISLLLGGILSWAIMWPVIQTQEGKWYEADLPSKSLHGIQGYRVFLAIAMMLGDGLFQVVFIIVKSYLHRRKQARNTGEVLESSSTADIEDEQKRLKFFEKDQIPTWVACLGYMTLAALSIVTVPFIFHQVKWYHLLVAYLIAPILAFCNSYGCGLTDWSLASNYGKICIFIFSGWVGLNNGGIIAGLAACGVMMSIVSTASDLMQDFKTGYLTLSSPRSMFISQVFGTFLGCIMTPFIYSWFFYNRFPVGDPNGTYPAPYGLMYRGIALIGAQGLSALPNHCLELAIGCFVLAIVLNLISELLRWKESKYSFLHKFIPKPMAMAIPFVIGAYFAIDMCIGSLILFIWEKKNKKQADDYSPAVASGLICGDSLWGIPSAIMSMVGWKAPFCMKFW